jgi:hypothetical protein
MHLPQPLEIDADRVHLRLEAVLDAYQSISRAGPINGRLEAPIKKLEPDAG